MNAITHTAAYCFYPWTTLAEMTLAFRNQCDDQVLAKYRARGFRIWGPSISLRNKLGGLQMVFLHNLQRWAGDSDTWIIEFDRHEFSASALQLSSTQSAVIPAMANPIAYSSWTLIVCDGYARIRYLTFCSPLFRYNYIFSDEEIISQVLIPFFRRRKKNEVRHIPSPSNCHRDTLSYWLSSVESARKTKAKRKNAKWLVL
jgi:hypothetical protein